MRIFVQIVLALQYLHGHHILHRYAKGEPVCSTRYQLTVVTLAILEISSPRSLLTLTFGRKHQAHQLFAVCLASPEYPAGW
jgi:serine/threonine protein kinase